jgi:hypothetical protein
MAPHAVDMSTERTITHHIPDFSHNPPESFK